MFIIEVESISPKKLLSLQSAKEYFSFRDIKKYLVLVSVIKDDEDDYDVTICLPKSRDTLERQNFENVKLSSKAKERAIQIFMNMHSDELDYKCISHKLSEMNTDVEYSTFNQGNFTINIREGNLPPTKKSVSPSKMRTKMGNMKGEWKEKKEEWNEEIREKFVKLENRLETIESMLEQILQSL